MIPTAGEARSLSSIGKEAVAMREKIEIMDSIERSIKEAAGEGRYHTSIVTNNYGSEAVTHAANVLKEKEYTIEIITGVRESFLKIRWPEPFVRKQPPSQGPYR